MRKELVIEPDVNPLSSCSGQALTVDASIIRSSPCKLTGVEHPDIHFTKCDSKPQRSQVLLVQGHKARKSRPINLPQLSGPSVRQLPALTE